MLSPDELVPISLYFLTVVVVRAFEMRDGCRKGVLHGFNVICSFDVGNECGAEDLLTSTDGLERDVLTCKMGTAGRMVQEVVEQST